MRIVARSSIALTLVGLVAVACAAGASTTPVTSTTPTQVATVSPTATDAPTTQPTETPAPTTDGTGPEYVSGTSSVGITKSGTQTVVGDVTQLRGQEMTDSGTMNDPRINGTAHITLNADFHGDVAAEWGTTRVENAGGAWEGTWTGASWNAGNATSVSGWLVGSGAYAGYTYYFNAHGPMMPFRVDGIIFPGSPPTP